PCSVSTLRRSPRSLPFPYTTLFRSFLQRLRGAFHVVGLGVQHLGHAFERAQPLFGEGLGGAARQHFDAAHTRGHAAFTDHAELRSEEHTSELQSRENLVCRLLLEKK